MEDVEVIKDFLQTRNSGYGRGYGPGSGSGSGDGSGYGSDCGDGDRYGCGYGHGYSNTCGYSDGCGHGCGYGCGGGSSRHGGYGYTNIRGNDLKEFNGERVFYIDGVPTLIDHVRGDYAKGRIVNDDFTTDNCYIVRVGNHFAHGETLHQAFKDAEAKVMKGMPLEELIAKFNEEFPSLSTTATCATFYNWHHILTGSCTTGRDNFIKAHGLDMDKEYTVEYFLDIVKDYYGRDVIRQLRETYEI
jgi:hypothetical protein